MKRLTLAVAALFMGLNLSAQWRFGNQPVQNNVQSDLEKNIQKLVMASVMINNFYVDSVDSKKLTEDAINGILMKLDPHSAYTNAADTKKFTEPLEGSFEGIGVQFNMLEDTLLVIQPVPKGPSERVGILAGDRIVSVADTAIAGVKMSREEIMHRLRGKKGTIAHLGVVRRGIKDTLYFDVKRDRIPVNSVDAAYMVTPNIGLIRFNNFAQTTHDEVVQAIKKLKEQGMKDLIIDLQQNSGGFLQAAADIASEFLPKGDMIVYTKGRSVPSQEFRSSGGGAFQEGKVAVLIDEYSASAAEILSGAIQDQDRGIVVGRRSFGKGLVQRPFDMPDGSMIRLTTARYYTPSGRSIQKPYEKGKGLDYAKDVINRYNKGELTNADSIHFPDSLRYQTRYATKRYAKVAQSMAAAASCPTASCRSTRPVMPSATARCPPRASSSTPTSSIWTRTERNWRRPIQVSNSSRPSTNCRRSSSTRSLRKAKSKTSSLKMTKSGRRQRKTCGSSSRHSSREIYGI